MPTLLTFVKLPVYPLTAWVLFLYNLIDKVAEISSHFLLHLNMWFVVQLLTLLLHSALSHLRGIKTETHSTDEQTIAEKVKYD
jgi:hypothetical protein